MAPVADVAAVVVGVDVTVVVVVVVVVPVVVIIIVVAVVDIVVWSCANVFAFIKCSCIAKFSACDRASALNPLLCF